MSADPIRWISTRDPGGTPVGFVEAMLRGLAPDGGLYVPDRVPVGVAAPPEADFGRHAASTLRPWLEADFGAGTVDEVASEALDFPVPAAEPYDGIFVLELFHGPTLSFKDFGARTMARLLQRVAGGQGRTVFVATSGDTGSAVADGFAGLPGIRVVLLYPRGQVSPVQERQLAAPRPGVLALRVDGTFDDCQRLVKAVFAEPRFERWRPTSANSINVGRLVPQTTYHAWAAALVPDSALVVPSGNLGNLTAAVLAQRAGARVRALVAAHNANDGFPAFLAGGPPPSAPSVRTLSNAMDVGVPSNFERLRAILGDSALRRSVRGERVSDGQTLDTMTRVYRETGYVCDPHTAVGLEAVRRCLDDGVPGPFVVMATAHPAKFPETVRRAIGRDPVEPPALAALPEVPDGVPGCAPTTDALYAALGALD